MKHNLRDETYWLELLLHGDKSGLEYFYKKYYNLLYNYGMKLHKDPDMIQDFIQDIFYKLYKREKNLQVSNVKVYLLRSMRNIIYDHYVSRKEIVSIDEMKFILPEDDHSLKSFFAKDDADIKRLESLLAAINALPNQQKQILYLYYIKGLSHKEISLILNINVQSSMNSLSRSLKKLRDLSADDHILLLLFFLNLELYIQLI